MNIKKVRRSIDEATTSSMTRMEAWSASRAAGVDVTWETFKRIWAAHQIEKRKSI